MADEPNEIVAGSKAVEETAKAVSKAIDASSAVASWLNELIGKPVLNAAGIFTDPIWAYREINLAKLQAKVRREREAQGIDQPTTLELRIAMPIIREASEVEDETLQELWAKLITNATNPAFAVRIERSYIGILAELTPFDAVVFESIVKLPNINAKDAFQMQRMADFPFNPLSADTEVSICNIHRLGLLRSASDSYEAGDAVKPRLRNYRGGENLLLSALGQRFHAAIS